MGSLRPVDILIRIEWGALFLAALVGYGLAHGSWLLFALLILAPDISMLAYLGGPRVGAIAYNAFHVLVWPLGLLLAGFYAGQALPIQLALIWLAHIGMDRMLGYGLKLPSGFRDTNLGRIGHDRP